MKKGLLLVLGASAAFSLFAQAPQTPKIAGCRMADLNLKKAGNPDNSGNFFASASAMDRHPNQVAPLAEGTMFTSSYNAFTLLVSQSHMLYANQALSAVLFTHRMSRDWPADANVGSGYIEYSWTTDFGATWDSSYYQDQAVLANKAFRYPTGAILNPTGNTSVANAYSVSTGPWTNSATSGNSWLGYYANYQKMMNGATMNTTVFTVSTPGSAIQYFPRIGSQVVNDSTYWVTSSLYNDPASTTNPGLRGAGLMKGTYSMGNMVWTFDSIKPSVHHDGSGNADMYS
ncbi:MAG TPA: hypothetical protein VFU15_02905, partial [Bacteroidia bacterium]|nr:hypothetical protein [Bacteroidia bacterium]